MPAGDVFGDMMNKPKKYVVSKTLKKPIWRRHDDHSGQRDRVGACAEGAAGKNISRMAAVSSSTLC